MRHILLPTLLILGLLGTQPVMADFTNYQYNNFYIVKELTDSKDMFYMASAVMLRETQAGEYPYLIDQVNKHRSLNHQSFGLMQIQVGTARHMMRVNGYGDQSWSDTFIANKLLKDHRFNIKTGIYYLQWLMSIGLTKEEAITAYNMGPGRYHLINFPKLFPYTKYVLSMEGKLRKDSTFIDFRKNAFQSKDKVVSVLATCNSVDNRWYSCDNSLVSKLTSWYKVLAKAVTPNITKFLIPESEYFYVGLVAIFGSVTKIRKKEDQQYVSFFSSLLDRVRNKLQSITVAMSQYLDRMVNSLVRLSYKIAPLE